MFTAGSGENGLAIVLDVRSAHDRELNTVLDSGKWLTRPLGGDHRRTLRIALRETGEPAWKIEQIRSAAPGFWALIKERGIKSIVIISGTKTPKSKEKPGHEAWAICSGRPGSAYKWHGTALHEHGVYKVPIPPPWMYEPVYQYLTDRWLKMALGLATGRIQPFPWPNLVTDDGDPACAALERIMRRGEPVGVDIETTKDKQLMTAIGIADSQDAVSVPWDRFRTCEGLWEPEISAPTEVLVRAILEGDQEKILQNGAFDIVQLAKRGIPVKQYLWDTMLLHRVAYPQYPHDLQFVAATELCVEPWKRLWKQPHRPKGVDKEEWDPFTYRPAELRTYNAKDAAILVPVTKSLRKKVGV